MQHYRLSLPRDTHTRKKGHGGVTRIVWISCFVFNLTWRDHDVSTWRTRFLFLIFFFNIKIMLCSFPRHAAAGMGATEVLIFSRELNLFSAVFCLGRIVYTTTLSRTFVCPLKVPLSLAYFIFFSVPSVCLCVLRIVPRRWTTIAARFFAFYLERVLTDIEIYPSG